MDPRDIYKVDLSNLDKGSKFVNKLKSMPPSTRVQNPLDTLSEEDKRVWEELKAAIKSGALNHLSMNEIHRQVCAHFKISLPRTTFRDILAREKVSKPKPK